MTLAPCIEIDVSAPLISIGSSSVCVDGCARMVDIAIAAVDVHVDLAGIQGPPGASGTGGDKTYRHQQMIPAAVWTVTHGLNKYPAVSVVDSARTLVAGDVDYLDTNTVQLSFVAAFSGEAYFN